MGFWDYLNDSFSDLLVNIGLKGADTPVPLLSLQEIPYSGHIFSFP